MVDPVHVPDQASSTKGRGQVALFFPSPQQRQRRDRGSHNQQPTTFKFKFKEGSVDNHETVAMVVSDDDTV